MNLKLLNDKKTSWVFRVIRWLVWLFSPKYQLEGTENLPDEPCVIVGNHSHMYGPIMGELYTPVKHYVWCAGEMMKREEVAAYAYRDFWSGKPKGTRWFYRILSHLITPLALCVFNNADTIPVYKDARLIRTFRTTMDTLSAGSDVVIFPEEDAPYNHILCRFQDKFVDTARFYYKKTGKVLSFVPMYIAPRLKMVVFGPPVRFDPTVPMRTQRDTICRALMDRVTELALALPPHTVVPYRNIPKKDYPKNVPAEVSDP